MISQFAFRFCSSPFPDLPPNPLPEGRGNVDGWLYRFCDVPDGDFLSIRVVYRSPARDVPVSSLFPLGERAGERGLGGRGEGLPMISQFAFRFCSSPFPDLPPNPLPEGRGNGDGWLYRFCDVPDGDFLSIRVVYRSPARDVPVSSLFPLGERAGERGRRGEGEGLPMISQFAFRFCSSPFPDLPPNPLPEGRGNGDGWLYRLCDVPDGDFLSIRVVYRSPARDVPVSSLFPLGERAGKEVCGVRGCL